MSREDSKTTLTELQMLILSGLKSSGVELGLTTGIMLMLETQRQQTAFLAWIHAYLKQHSTAYPTPSICLTAAEQVVEKFPA